MNKKLEEKIKRAKKEGVDIKLTGSEFRQYVHISTRKMKYLMDNDIVPHLNTGQTTHKYDIKKSDADEFLRKVKCDPAFMSDCKGLFSSRYEHPKRFEPLNADKERETKRDLNEKYSHAVSYFTYLWRDQPDILRATAAADLIGANRQYIRRKQESDELNVVMIKGTLMLSKRELIRFVCTKKHIFNPPTIKLKELIAQI